MLGFREISIRRTLNNILIWFAMNINPVWLSAISSLILALAAIAAVYRDFIIGLFYHPDLIFKEEPFLHRIPLVRFENGVAIAEANTDYFRLRVFNAGKIAAKDVEVLVTEVRSKHPDGRFKPKPLATPYNLHWTHRIEAALPIIHPKSERHITLGYIIDPDKRSVIWGDSVASKETLFELDFTVKSTNREYLLPPGEYQIDIQIVASNLTEPKKSTIYLNHIGKWFIHESEMYSKGFGIKFLHDKRNN